MFLISQVGQEESAKQFLDRLEGDAGIERVLFRTAGGSILRSQRLTDFKLIAA